MKVAVSIPDDLFEKAERLRRKERRSRSKVFAAALTEYVARHATDEVTEAMNRVCADVNTAPHDFIQTASRRILEQSEWQLGRVKSGGLTCARRLVLAQAFGDPSLSFNATI